MSSTKHLIEAAKALAGCYPRNPTSSYVRNLREAIEEAEKAAAEAAEEVIEPDTSKYPKFSVNWAKALALVRKLHSEGRLVEYCDGLTMSGWKLLQCPPTRADVYAYRIKPDPKNFIVTQKSFLPSGEQLCYTRLMALSEAKDLCSRLGSPWQVFELKEVS